MARIIDDFSTGTYDVTIKNGSDLNYQKGESILGGQRYTVLTVGLNPQEQSAHLDITNGNLNLSVGVLQYLRLDVVYGLEQDVAGTTLIQKGAGDFKAMGSAFKVNFRFTDTMPLNLNIVIYTEAGYASYSSSIGESAFSPNPRSFQVKFDQFQNADQADFSKVGGVHFVFDSWADFVIDSIEIV